MTAAMQWDPVTYGRYSGERSRPFVDLVARIAAVAPRVVADVGCGSGELTALLARRWPAARVHGVDSSEQMIAAAGAHASSRVSFERGDALTWTPPADVDVIVSNAVLQWVPEHRELLASWAAALPRGGWLAMQVPGNFDAPSHALMRELAGSPQWAPQLAGVLRHGDAVDTAADYARLFLAAGLDVDAWETRYLHVLRGRDPVLEWVRGTGLRPVLAALPEPDAARFEEAYAQRLRAAYPRVDDRTMFSFRRIFAVGHRS